MTHIRRKSLVHCFSRKFICLPCIGFLGFTEMRRLALHDKPTSTPHTNVGQYLGLLRLLGRETFKTWSFLNCATDCFQKSGVLQVITFRNRELPVSLLRKQDDLRDDLLRVP
jgi:hypothetical protein